MIAVTMFLAVAVLGIAAGALVAEGAVLVPFWRSLAPEAFLAWYRSNARILLRFFGPVEVAAALLPGLAALIAWASGSPGAPQLGVATALSLVVLASFPVYFRDANASFAEGTIEHDKVSDELRRWARWHWFRTAVALLAFLASISGALAD